MTIKTDNKWHNFKYGYELPKKWRKEFDWMSDEEYDAGNFAVYKGRVYGLDEFMKISHAPEEMKKWDGYINDTYFSGVVIKISDDGERYKIGYFYS